jgi:hypothetical protein
MAKFMEVKRGQPKYPNVRINVAGPRQQTGDPNCSFVATVAAVQNAMREADVPQQDLSNFYVEAAESDDLLQTCVRWVQVIVR